MAEETSSKKTILKEKGAITLLVIILVTLSVWWNHHNDVENCRTSTEIVEWRGVWAGSKSRSALKEKAYQKLSDLGYWSCQEAKEAKEHSESERLAQELEARSQ